MTELVGQEELAEKRRLSQALREIENLHAIQIVAIQTWVRHRDNPSTGVAQRALTQLMEARREENAVLRNVLGIDTSIRAIGRH
jgi:hypothetical protein